MKILFAPTDAHGHVNSCIGLARILENFGHECIFIIPKHWTKLVAGYNFSVETYQDPEASEDQDTQEKWGNFMKSVVKALPMNTLDQFRELLAPAHVVLTKSVQAIDDQIAELIAKVKPNLIIKDFVVPVPSIVNSGLPWILLCSPNPIRLYSGPNVPPGSSGLGIGEDPKVYQDFTNSVLEYMKPSKDNYEKWLLTKGITPTPFALGVLSPYLNIYSYPAEIDYSELQPATDKIFRLDHMVRSADDAPLGFDESFFDLPDKKIYFSLGSMGGADVDLMHKLIEFLSKCKHKIIVSKGPFPDQIELAPNMVGGKYINQIKILPKVDLVITHGGNNTFVETLCFGKSMIVMPLFGDQHDNGRRAEDKKVGKCLYPHKVTEDQLLTAIDDILSDTELIERVTKIGENTRNSKSHSEFNKKLQEIVDNHVTCNSK